jgi:hypothetical protein
MNLADISLLERRPISDKVTIALLQRKVKNIYSKNKSPHLSSLLHTFSPSELKATIGFIRAKITPTSSHTLDVAKILYIKLRVSIDFFGYTASNPGLLVLPGQMSE